MYVDRRSFFLRIISTLLITTSTIALSLDIHNHYHASSYVYLHKEHSPIAELVSELISIDDQSKTPLHALQKSIEEGFLFIEADQLNTVLDYAHNVLQKKYNFLTTDYAQALSNHLKEVRHHIAQGAFSIDTNMIIRSPHLRTLIVDENMDVLGEATFYKHVRTKQGIHVSGKLEVAKKATFKSNVKIKGTLSAADAIIASLSVGDITVNTFSVTDAVVGSLSVTDLAVASCIDTLCISNLSVTEFIANNLTINGTLSTQDEVVNGNLQISSLTSPGVLHNDASGNISTSLVTDADITSGTITNDKLANISSDDIPGDIVVRDGSGNFATNMITLDGSVVNPTDAATKAYVDSVVTTGIVPKAPAVVISLTNQALSGLTTIDGVALSAGDRVLLNGQTNPVENGLWVVQGGAWNRPADFASGTEAGSAYVLILSGTINAGTSWLCSTPNAIIDTDPINFVLFSTPNSTNGANVGVGTGLIFRDKTGNTLNFKSLIQASHIIITNNANDITLATDGTSSNTINTLVARDASGNFSAGTITATLNGNAATATTTTNFSGSLAGEVTGPQTATVVSNAVSTNTANAIVRRTATGGFSAGAISMTDSIVSGNLILTTEPSTSTAGNILKGSNRFIHDTGTNNIFAGINAGTFVTTGTGQNSAFGASALTSITTGSGNIAIGYQAGQSLITGNGNIYINANAATTNESSTIRIGSSQTSTFIAGISGIGVSGDAVSIDSNGQLGITLSSRKFKHNIEDMGKISEKILQLRPVTFIYNNNESDMQEFGLIAEEVDEIFPAIVARDKEGLPYTVRYHLLPILLLNELQKQYAIIEKIKKEYVTKDELSAIMNNLQQQIDKLVSVAE